MTYSVLVTGSNGQLGIELSLIAKSSSNKFFFLPKEELNITNDKDIRSQIEMNNIDVIINCAAYTNVDEAEKNQELANGINRYGVKKLVDASIDYGIILIHISTDYVFDGESRVPYIENHRTNPKSIYGQSKLDGELEILDSEVKAIIIRTSWLYSNLGHNFLNSILSKAKSHKLISVVEDQVGTPNNAADLAQAIIKIIHHERFVTASQSREIFHFNSNGEASWYSFAQSIISNSNLNCTVKPIKTENLRQPAERPKYSVLSNEKISMMFDLVLPKWEDSLKNTIENNQILSEIE